MRVAPVRWDGTCSQMEPRMNIPAGLKYTESHEWVDIRSDGSLVVGITDHAQEALGEIVFIELPKSGVRVAAGDAIAVIESAKAASDIHAPVSGEIVAFNDAVSVRPDQINDAPYESWLFKIRPSADASVDSLMSPDAYGKAIGAV